MGLLGRRVQPAELSANGVKRVSVGSASPSRVRTVLDAAKEMLQHGHITFARDAVPFAVLEGVFADEPHQDTGRR